MRLNCQIIFFASVLTLIASSSDRLASPEFELQRALTQLENIENALEGSTKVIETQLSGPKKVSAKAAYEHSIELFKQGHFLASTKQMNNYLNLVQVPDPRLFLEAQLTLGQAYEQAGLPSRALRAYMRYIAGFSTAPKELRDYQMLTSVMQRTLPLSAKESEGAREKLNRLFASVIGMDMPKERKAEVYYFAASHSPDQKLAKEWFQKADELTEDKAIDSRVNYFRAVIALQNSEFNTAEALLKRNLEYNEASSQEFKDLARIALARIAVRQRKLELALKHYQLIGEDSPSYKDALFETMYLYLDNGQSDVAKAKAQTLAERYPETNEGFQAKTLLSYFALRKGDLAQARTSISSVDRELSDLDRWITTKYRSKDRLTHGDVNILVETSQTHIPQSETIQSGYRIFGKLAEQRRRLADVRSDIRNLLYTLGKMNIKEMQPNWVNRAQLLGDLSEQTLEVGHRLMASYAYLLKDQLSEAERHALEASQQRRFRLFSQAAKLARQKSSWTTWANSVTLIHDASDKVEKVRELQAQIASARYLNTKSQEPAAPKTDLAVLQQKAHAMEESLNRTIETIRRFQVLDLSKQGPYAQTQTLHQQYANLLHEEAGIVSDHLDRMQAPSWRFVANDAQRAWKRWEYVSKIVFEKLARLESSVSTDLKELVKTLDQYIADHDEMVNRIALITNNLEAALGESLGSSLAHYQAEITERQAKHQKWQADMDWIEFEQLSNESQAIERRRELEEQILRDNLRDLRQGVFW
jgi:hypothetical protein